MGNGNSGLKQGIDLPVMQQLAQMPYTYNYHNSVFVSDRERYIYWISGYGTSTFYRYDTFTDGWTQLASTPVVTSSSGYTTTMTYDYSRHRIYCAFGGATSFYYYDVDANLWSSALAVLPATCNAGGTIEHTCPYNNSSGNDDYIYYIPADGSSLKLYRYSISGNTWLEMGTNIIPSAPSYGANLIWIQGVNTDWLMIFRGAATRIAYIYSISGNNIVATQEFKGSSGSLGSGTISDYMASTNEIFWTEASSRQLNKVKINVGGQETGTATSGTANTLTCSSKTWEVNFWLRYNVTITSGTGVGQCRSIKSNTANSLTVYPNWTVQPDSTSVFEIKNSVFDYGTATAGTTTTLTCSSKTWIANAWQYAQIKITSGTGAGQLRYIASNTTNAITISVAWTTTPDTTSTFEIIGYNVTPETLVPFSASTSYYGNTMVCMDIKGLQFVYLSRKSATTDWFRYLVTSP